MACLIIGSPSTGTSLLRRILNRHTEIFCGSETSLFAKSVLYNDWNKHKNKLMWPRRWSLVNDGWHHMRGITIEDDYNISGPEIRSLIKRHSTFDSFLHEFFNYVLEQADKSYWIEKTPSNAFTGKEFLSSFTSGKVIHIVRHPLDVIASLVIRGMDAYNAVCTYLCNTSSAMRGNDSISYHIIKYEDLVLDSQSTLEGLLLFLGYDYQSNMLDTQPKAEKGATKMKGWKYEETAKIGQGSIGRFQELTKDQQKQIACYIRLLRCTINDDLASVMSLADILQYDMSNLPDLTISKDQLSLASTIKKDMRKRSWKKAYYNSSNYPIYVVS